MNKSEQAERLAGRTGMSKVAAKDAVDGVFETIGEALANGDEARILGFGTFGTRNRPARTVRNPRTGESLSVAASTVPGVQGGRDAQGCRGQRSVMNGGRIPREGHAKPVRDSRLKSPAFAAKTGGAPRSFQRNGESRPGLGLRRSARPRPRALRQKQAETPQ